MAQHITHGAAENSHFSIDSSRSKLIRYLIVTASYDPMQYCSALFAMFFARQIAFFNSIWERFASELH
jgi:hypothetical protein